MNPSPSEAISRRLWNPSRLKPGSWHFQFEDYFEPFPNGVTVEDSQMGIYEISNSFTKTPLHVNEIYQWNYSNVEICLILRDLELCIIIIHLLLYRG